MTQTSSECGGAMVLLIPPVFLEAVHGGDAEIIEETREVTEGVSPSPSATHPTRRVLLHIFSEEERVQRLSADLPPAVVKQHQLKVQELRRARDTLLAEGQLRPYLVSEDAVLWPSTESIGEVVRLLKQLKESAQPPDVMGGERLLKAWTVVHREATQPGLYPLTEAPVAGSLTTYIRKLTEPSLHRQESFPMVFPTAYRLGEVGGSTSQGVRLLSDVLQLPLTARTMEQLLTVLLSGPFSEKLHISRAPGPSTTKADQSKWASLVSLHRKSLSERGRPLFMTVKEALTEFHCAQEMLVGEILAIAADGLCTPGHSHPSLRCRLRTGIYATVVQRTELSLIIVRRPKDGAQETSPWATLSRLMSPILDPRLEAYNQLCGAEVKLLTLDDVASAEKVLQKPLLRMLVAGEMRVVPLPFIPLASWSSAANLMEDEVKWVEEHFMSPLVATGVTPSLITCKRGCSPVALGPHVKVIQLTIETNPFVVIHGSRVENGVEGRASYVDELRRWRDQVAERQMEDALRAAHTQQERLVEEDEPPTKTARVDDSHAFSGTVRTGEDMRRAVTGAVMKILSVSPCTKAELRSHRDFSQLLNFPGIDNLLKAVLKDHTEFKGKKYVLRD